MKSFFGFRISRNQTKTPDGFLVAHNVPISRTGMYEYLGSELPPAFELEPDKLYKVFRSPEEVFAPASMASFEGKPLTDGHPPDGINPENATMYLRGSAQNVRQGTAENSDLLLADLIVYDRQLMEDIQNGKREVSAGYEFDCIPNEDGTFSQKNIVGNHVAVVQNGRAGGRVRINDKSPVRDDTPLDDEAKKASEKYGIAVKGDGHKSPPEGYPADREQYADPVNFKYPLNGAHAHDAIDYYNSPDEREKGDYTTEEWSKIGRRIVDKLGEGYALTQGQIVTPDDRRRKGNDSMPKVARLPRGRVRDWLAATGLKHFATDADPEDVMDAVDAMAEERAADEAEEKGTPTPKEDDKKVDGAKDEEAPNAALQAQIDKLTEIVGKLAEAQAQATAPEDAIDAAIAQMENPENTPPKGDEESNTIPAEQVGDDGVTPVTPPSDRPVSALNTVDSAYRLSALKAIKPVIAAIKDPAERKKASDAAVRSIMGMPSSNTYAAIDQANRKTAKDGATNAKKEFDMAQLGRDIAAKRNPHYKEQK